MRWRYMGYNMALGLLLFCGVYFAHYFLYPYKQLVIIVIGFSWYIMNLIMGHYAVSHSQQMDTCDKNVEKVDK